jgi:hypothetical protein
MRALTLDDLLPLEEFASRRREFFESNRRYLDRYRRVRIGPRVTLLFENRQTLWFRIQEMLRVARLADPERVSQELEIYNRLLPGRDCLQAALILEVAEESRLSEELAPWRSFRGNHLKFHLDENRYPADLMTCRPEDCAMGVAHWVQFHLSAEPRQLLADFRYRAWFSLSLDSYSHESDPLSDDVRQSLQEDLQASDRD